MRKPISLLAWRKALIPALFLLGALLSGMVGCAAIKENLNYTLALEDFKKSRYDSSEGYLQSVLQENPNDEKAISLLGWIRIREGRRAEAEELFAKAEKLNPENPGTIEGLGWVYYWRGDDSRAQEKFQKLGKYAQEHLQDPYWRNYSAEDQEYIQACDSDANYALALIAKRRGLWSPARTYFERSLSQPNQFIPKETLMRELADALFELGEYRGAAEQYRNLIAHSPKDPFLLANYAFCLYRTGNLGEAGNFYEQAEKMNVGEARFYRNFKGEQSVTQKIYAKGIAEPYYGLALIYAREKKVEQAREKLAIALKISPFFRHPEEIVGLFRGHPDWLELIN